MAKIGIKTSAGIVPFNGGSGGGHTIVDDSGTSMTQRSNLKFVGATVTDDAVNDTTIIEIESGGGTLIVQPPVAASQTYTYDGTEQTFQFSSIDTANCTISNNKKTAAGTYTVTVSLKETNYVWADDLTNADRTFTWTIAKAASSISVSPASITFDADNLTATLVPTTTGDGTVSYAIDKPSIATIAGNVVTATQTTGTATITATISETTNYASASTTISVEATFTIPQTITVDIYSAAADTLSYTDLNGAQTVVTDSTGKAESVSITYDVDNPSITFTSSVAKSTSDLSVAYSKTITLTANTTAVYVMPDKVFYWYGYENSELGLFSYLTYFKNYTATFTKNTNNIVLTGAHWAALNTDKLIDLSAYNSVKWDFVITQVGQWAFVNPVSGYGTSFETWQNTRKGYLRTDFTAAEGNMYDISVPTNEEYILDMTIATGSSPTACGVAFGSYEGSQTLYRVWLE